MKELFIAGVIALGAGTGLGLMIVHAVDQQDKIDCLTWAQQADVYPAFFITQGEKDQCDYWKIPVAAPVHGS